MKKIIVSLLLILFASGPAYATYTGSLVGGDTLYGTGSWSSGVLSWSVFPDEANSSLWVYNYTFSVKSKEISHMIFEVSDNFTSDNIFKGTTEGYELDTFRSRDKSNPGMPVDVFGIKWETSGLESSVTIVTDRTPMWGDFYAKDGVEKGTGWIYAYNTNFGSNTTLGIGSGNGGGWALVPNSHTSPPVPEPATFVLLGFGIAGIGGFYRKRKHVRSA